jgi:hypothetical protein
VVHHTLERGPDVFENRKRTWRVPRLRDSVRWRHPIPHWRVLAEIYCGIECFSDTEIRRSTAGVPRLRNWRRLGGPARFVVQPGDEAARSIGCSRQTGTTQGTLPIRGPRVARSVTRRVRPATRRPGRERCADSRRRGVPPGPPWPRNARARHPPAPPDSPSGRRCSGPGSPPARR